MKLSKLIAVWDTLHTKDTGELSYCDIEGAIEKTCGVENDVFYCHTNTRKARTRIIKSPPKPRPLPYTNTNTNTHTNKNNNER